MSTLLLSYAESARQNNCFMVHQVGGCVLIYIILVYFIHSLDFNSIKDEGAIAVSEAMKTMTNLQRLKYVDLVSIIN